MKGEWHLTYWVKDWDGMPIQKADLLLHGDPPEPVETYEDAVVAAQKAWATKPVEYRSSSQVYPQCPGLICEIKGVEFEEKT